MAYPQEDSDHLENLRKALYSRQGVEEHLRPQNLKPKDFSVPETWQPETPPPNAPAPKKSNFFKKLFILSIFILVLAAATAGYLYWKGNAVISAKNINISVLGPVSVAAGNVLSLDINVANQNPVTLQAVDILIQYPQDTRMASNTSSQLQRERFPIGDMAKDKIVQKTINAVLYGQEGDTKEIKIIVEYQLSNSNALFHADKIYSVVIGSSPISLKIDSLKEVNSGQEVTLNAHITSNSSNILKGILLKATYPFGFQFISATPGPSFSQNVWNIGDIEPGGSRDISIKGKIIGQDNDQRVIGFQTGTVSANNSNNIGTAFINTSQAIVVRKPFLGVKLNIEGSDADPYIVGQGQQMRGEITWSNNLDKPVNNADIILKFSGNIIDTARVNVHGGFYSSSNNSIEWNGDQNPELKVLNPGDSGKVDFTFYTIDLDGLAGSIHTNPKIPMEISISGKRFSEANVPEVISATLSRTVKVSANLKLGAKVDYKNGPYKNTGPIPPKVNTPTTYTITLQATNSLNEVRNAYVTAKLPLYMTWLSKSSDTSVAYNSTTREIKWDIGTVPAGAGYSLTAKQVLFQLSLLPSTSQIGNEPTLLDNIVLVGGDSFTGKDVKTPSASINTNISGSNSSVSDTSRVTQ